MRFQFVLSEIGAGLRRNFSMVVSVILVTFVSLTFVGAAALLQVQISHMKNFWYEKVQVAIYLCMDQSESPSCTSGAATDAQKKTIANALNSDELKPYVEKVYFENQSEAYKHFQEQFKGTSLEGTVTPKQLPESFRVKLVDPEKYEIIREYFASQPGVEEVQDQNEWLDQLFSLMNVATAVSLGVAVIMLVCAILLVGTTIRLSAFSRRRETGIMRLVGASNGFIQLPFVLEGVIAAAIGAVLASGALWALVHYFVENWLRNRVTSFSLIGTTDVLWVAPGLLVLGILVAAISSVVTLRRYLKV
ncbi:permease-like cell division protein FtsX [Spelaeicoccus albus]|uniref:Cell division protein FtsX n=1 Tax=Spelaeicoccus albus TaxID=1280376 RepID=A0A7Z0D5G4_9MICO|nr:permease-like cell division protein FtsX [Spelaeicoccus albus]NYI69255.1 cell division transport system permease protein [Spelaeicoccus albus]